MKQVKYLPFIILLFIVIAPILLSLLIRYLPNNYQPSLNSTQRIFGTTALSQSFVVDRDNLSGIGVSIKNPNLQNKKDLTLALYDEGILLREVTINGKRIEDGNFVKLFFPPVENSRNKQLNFMFFAPKAEEEEALEIFLSDEHPSFAGQLLVKEKLNKSTVSFVSFYSPNSQLMIMEEIFKQWVSKFISDGSFFIFYSVVILMLLLYLGYLSLNKKSNGKDPLN